MAYVVKVPKYIPILLAKNLVLCAPSSASFRFYIFACVPLDDGNRLDISQWAFAVSLVSAFASLRLHISKALRSWTQHGAKRVASVVAKRNILTLLLLLMH